jgi:ABC-type transport system involved in Fe-S cluster assembly fused permease/ATPase subunit
MVRDTGTTPLGRCAREIRFDGVDFGYAAGQRNLQGLSVSIPFGEYVAVVGSRRIRQEHDSGFADAALRSLGGTNHN